LLQHRFEKHDRSQLELKLTYGMDKDARKQKYRLEAFIFVPRVLAPTKHSYGKRLFYQDTATFIRRKTPSVALATLAKATGTAQWMSTFAAELNGLLSGEGGSVSKAVANLKVLACILKSSLRDESDDLFRRLVETIGQESSVGSAEHASRWLNTFCEQISGTLRNIRSAGEDCETAKTPSELRDAWRGVDEYISLIAEETLTETLSLLDKLAPNPKEEKLQAARAALGELAVNEYQHRRGRGFQTYVHENSRNEYLSHRRHVLKRFVSSVLYLDVRSEEAGRMVNNAIGMFAAAFAMLFATLAALWAQFEVGVSLSGAFISVMVLSYIVKDRIKDEGKRILGKRLGRWISDHVSKIRDEDTDCILGTCKENFYVADAATIEPAIRELRHADHPTSDAVEGRPETVLCYTKNVSISTAQIGKNSFPIDGLNDIIRFNVQRLTMRMDDPWDSYHYVDPTSREVSEIKCARVYHLNIVLRLTPATGEQTLERTRVIVDRKGIHRVEQVEAVMKISTNAVTNPAATSASSQNSNASVTYAQR
jgi:hypothetical protein